MIMADTWRKITEDFLEDGIRLVEPEQPTAGFENCDLSGTEIIDYGLEVQESELLGPAIQLSMGKQSSELLCNERNVVTHKLSVKLVDCKTFPWYFKKYKRQIYNIMASCNPSVKDGNIPEVNLLDENTSSNGEPLKNCTNINMSKVLNEVKKKNHLNLDNCLDFIKLNALKQRGCSKIDFKRNKGLIGLSIKRNAKYEKLKKAGNTSKAVGSKISGREDATSNDDIVCEYIIDNETITLSDNIEITKKPKATLSPGSYKLSHLTTGEKVITLVKSSQDSINLNKNDSTMNSSSKTKVEKLSKTIKSCVKKSDKKSSIKPKTIKNKRITTKNKPEKAPSLKKTIDKLLNKPMPKSRKLLLQKQRKECERKTKKSINIIDNTEVTNQVIVIGSRTSVGGTESTDMKSLVESKTLNNITKLEQQSEASSKNVDRRNTSSSNTTSLRNIKPFINKINSRNTLTKSSKMCSNTNVQSLDNSNLCGMDLTKSSSKANNLASETQTNLYVAPSMFNSKTAKASNNKDLDKVCLVPSKDNLVSENCDRVISDTVNVSVKSVDNLCSKSLNNSSPNMSSHSSRNPPSVLPSVDSNDQFISNSDNLGVTDLCKKSELSNLNNSNKKPDDKCVNYSPETSSNVQLESSDKQKSNVTKVLYPNTDTVCSISNDTTYSHSHIISKSTDKLFHSDSNLLNASSTQCPQSGLQQETVPPDTTKNVETESVCNIEPEIKKEPEDFIIDVVSTGSQEPEPQNNNNIDIPKNNQSNSAQHNNNNSAIIMQLNNKNKVEPQNNLCNPVSQHNTNTSAPQNNQINMVPQSLQNESLTQNNQINMVPQSLQNESLTQNNKKNSAEGKNYEYISKNDTNLPNPLLIHENTPVSSDKSLSSVSVPAKKPYIVRIKNPIPSNRIMHVDSTANNINHYQGPQPNSWNLGLDIQRPFFQEMIPTHPNAFLRPPYIPEHQNNPNNFYYNDHYRMPAMNPPMPRYIPQNLNWTPPNYFCNDNSLWNSNYPIQPNNSVISTNHDGSTKKVNICPKYSTAPIRHDITNMTIENVRSGKNLVSIPLKQNVNIGPSTSEPVKTRLEMLQELDSFIMPNSSNSSIPANNLQKSTSIPGQTSHIPSLLAVKPGALTQKPPNLSEFPKHPSYTTGILPISTFENMPPTHLNNQQVNSVRKPNEPVRKPKIPDRRYSTGNTNKQKISLAEYKRRACS